MENQRHRQQPEKTLRICERMHVCGHSLWGLTERGGGDKKDVTLKRDWHLTKYLLQWSSSRANICALAQTGGMGSILKEPPPLHFPFPLSLSPCCSLQTRQHRNTVTMPSQREKKRPYLFPTSGCCCCCWGRRRNVKQNDDKQTAEPRLQNPSKIPPGWG